MADEYARAALRTSCAEIVGVCARKAVDRTVRKRALFFLTREASHTLVDLCESFLSRVSTLAHDFAEHGGRANGSVLDLVRALNDLGERAGGDALTLPRLSEYAAVEELAPARVIPDFPVVCKRKSAGEERVQRRRRRRRRKRRRARREQQAAGVGGAENGSDDSGDDSEGGVDDENDDDGDDNDDDSDKSGGECEDTHGPGGSGARTRRAAGGSGGGHDDDDDDDDETTAARMQAWEGRVRAHERDGVGSVRAAAKFGRSDGDASGADGDDDGGGGQNGGDPQSAPHESRNGKRRSAPEVAGAGPHIADWMPSFPPSHTYVATPMYAETEGRTELEKLRKLNEQRLQAEEALARLRGTGFRAIDNPYLKLPKVRKGAARSDTGGALGDGSGGDGANDDGGGGNANDGRDDVDNGGDVTMPDVHADADTTLVLTREHASSREPLTVDTGDVPGGKVADQTLKSKAERILAESGTASGTSGATRRSSGKRR